jgi:hypothetical protein
MRRGKIWIATLVAILACACGANGGLAQSPSSSPVQPASSVGAGLPSLPTPPGMSSSPAPPPGCATVKSLRPGIPGKITAAEVPLPQKPGGTAAQDESTAVAHLKRGATLIAWRVDQCGSVNYLAVVPDEFNQRGDDRLWHVRIGDAPTSPCAVPGRITLVNPPKAFC